MTSEPTLPEVWWSPGMGLLELVGHDGDEANYECLNADEGRGDLLHHLPADAIELVRAPTEAECEAEYANSLLVEAVSDLLAASPVQHALRRWADSRAARGTTAGNAALVILARLVRETVAAETAGERR